MSEMNESKIASDIVYCNSYSISQLVYYYYYYLIESRYDTNSK